MKRVAFFFIFILFLLMLVYEFIKIKDDEKIARKSNPLKKSSLDVKIDPPKTTIHILSPIKSPTLEISKTIDTQSFLKKEERKKLILKSEIKKQQQTSQNVYYIESLNIAFLSDIFACIDTSCTDQIPFGHSNHFYLYKTTDSSQIKKLNQFMVVKNTNNPLYGVWENRLIIELNENRDFHKDFSEMGLEEIEKPQDLLYIVLYNKPLSELNDTVLNLKSIPQVKNVTPELTFSKQKGNQWQKK